MLIVYVNEIIISKSDYVAIADLKAYLSRQFILRSGCVSIANLKTYLAHQFHTKNLCTLRYFLGIKVPRSKMGINLSQRKSVLHLLSETRMLDSRLVDTPMDYHIRLDVTWESYLRMLDGIND